MWLQLAESLPRKTIFKRYSEFHKLDKGIRESPANRGSRFPELPPKHMIKMFRTTEMNEKVVEIRRVALESYLQELIADVNLRSVLLPSARATVLLPSARATAGRKHTCMQGRFTLL